MLRDSPFQGRLRGTGVEIIVLGDVKANDRTLG
jgi:hypothetical protein